jgi:hypothetical protein
MPGYYNDGIFLLSSRACPDRLLGPTQPPIQWVRVIKRPEREADHSTLCRAWWLIKQWSVDRRLYALKRNERRRGSAYE